MNIPDCNLLREICFGLFFCGSFGIGMLAVHFRLDKEYANYERTKQKRKNDSSDYIDPNSGLGIGMRILSTISLGLMIGIILTLVFGIAIGAVVWGVPPT